LAKQIYNNLFNWLVKRMNVTIEPAEVANPSFQEKAKTIGLLDIFGFENFPKGNNFE
jgi:myosin heavy subunit